MKINQASEASITRYNHALKLVSSCPPILFEEFALTDESAKGIADEASPLNIRLWSKDYPANDACISWLDAQGVRDIQLIPPAYTNGLLIVTGEYAGIALQVSWETLTTLDKNMKALMDANIIDPLRLYQGDFVLSAVLLEGRGVLEYWQNRLHSEYSDVLQTHLIQMCFKAWDSGEYHDPNVFYRALFAINRVWEPHNPDHEFEMTKLRHLPPNFSARLKDGDYHALTLDLLSLIGSLRPDLNGFISVIRAKIND